MPFCDLQVSFFFKLFFSKRHVTRNSIRNSLDLDKVGHCVRSNVCQNCKGYQKTKWETLNSIASVFFLSFFFAVHEYNRKCQKNNA